MKKLLTTFLALLIFASPVLAKVKSQQIPDVLIEGTVLTLRDENLSSKKNPLKIQVITIDGTVTQLTPFLDKTGKSAKVLLPLIPDVVGSLAQITIRISGGAIPASNPEDFARILTQKPAGYEPDPVDGNIASSQTSLPESSSIGVILEGPAGPAGPAGTQGPAGNPGANGAPGPTGPIPINYPGSSIVGDVASAVVFTGNLAGDVTGPMSATAISNATITNKELNGAYSASAGAVLNGDSLQTAISKLDGNIQNNDSSIATINSTLGTPTSSNVGGEIVERDSTGSFSANIITANLFNGNVEGNVSGDVTGNLAGQVTTATQLGISGLPALATAGAIGGTTTFASTVVTPKIVAGNLNGAFNGSLIGNVTGDLTGTVLTANQHEIKRMNGLIRAGTSGIKTTFLGPVNGAEGFIGNLTGNLTGTVLTTTQNSIATMTGLTNVGTAGIQTQFQGQVKGNQGFLGNLTGDVTGNVNGNVNGNATNSTNAVNVTGPAQPAITSLGGIAQLGSFGNNANFAGSISVAQNANIVGALSAGSLSSSGTITAPKFVGNLQGTVLTAAQPNITNLAALANVGTSTTFAGQVTATQFNGPLNGNATTATSFTSALDGEVNGTQLVTKIKDGVVPGKKLLGTYTAAAGTVTNGDTIKGAIQKLDGNTQANAAAIVVNTGAIATLNSNVGGLTVTGGTVALTATGATTLTLPTTGTLATTADLSSGLAGKADAATVASDLAGKQPLDAALTSISGLSTSANQMIYTTAADTYATTSATLLGRNNLALGTALNVETEVSQTYNATNIGFVTMIDTDADANADDILTISGGSLGQRLVIVVGSTSTATVDLVDGGNLSLTTTFSGSAGDTIELVSDGTTWYEISRSDN